MHTETEKHMHLRSLKALLTEDCITEEEYKAEKKAKAEKIEVYVLEDDEFEQSITHRDQCNADLGDYVNERLERGEIDEENAAELRMGA